MGSAKGRALLVASEFFVCEGYRRRTLTTFCIESQKKNIKRYRPASQQCTAFHLQCMNVVDDVFGQEPLVPFLADPFGREFGSVPERNASRSSYCRYIYPQFEDLLRSSAFLRRVREGGPRWGPWSRYVVYAASAAEARSGGVQTRPSQTIARYWDDVIDDQ